MIARYTRPAMGRIWSDDNRFRCWLEVEKAVAAVEAEAGMIPPEAAQAICEHGRFEAARIAEVEREVKHDVIAFTTSVSESLAGLPGNPSRYLHYGLTSNDVVDTAQALQVKEASALLLEGLKRLGSVLERRAQEFRHTVMIGRTHGVHAEPTTFGLKLAVWYTENKRNMARLSAAAGQMRVGKLSGAVGNLAHLTTELETKVCERLGLEPAEVTTQVIQRDRHAWYIATLAVIASTLDKIAVEVRGLQRTEVREAEEYFSKGQKGSSAMPHKRNPITAEQISGLARVIRGNAQAALENVALWHERDISHSSVERVIFPDSCILLDYLLDRTATLVEKLLVYPERMRQNLEMTRGLVFSGQLLLDLAEKGVLREEAYRWVQRNAMAAWESGGDFREMVLADSDISRVLSRDEILSVFEAERQLHNVDAIFARAFGKKNPPPRHQGHQEHEEASSS